MNAQVASYVTIPQVHSCWCIMELGWSEMCGRFSMTWRPELVQDEFPFALRPPDMLEPRYNIPPGGPVLAVAMNRQETAVGGLIHWGMTSGGGARLIINARAETAEEKPMFRPLLETGRCLVPADGYYEWQAGTVKTPFRLTSTSGQLLWFAALYRRRRVPHPSLTADLVILTREATPAIRGIHERMPLILPQERLLDWLRPDGRSFESVFADARVSEVDLCYFPVTRRVNRVDQDDPGLHHPVESS